MNIANKLTMLRILLVPVFVIALMLVGTDTVIPLLLFSIAAATDALDGYFARSRNLITTFGKFLDPIADKLLVISAFVMFVEMGLVPGWAALIIISRELIITGFRVIAASNNVTIAASVFGKIKTITQFAAIILMLLPMKGLETVAQVLLYLSVIATALSGVDYVIKNKEVLDLDNI
ncbi:MAG: CDP-diacylglycerol--glycerol-3-phosphate 3-phosphatidyltransferase [Tissierellia bacterium]|nr:CDP-diacylglycerol--glycerol-3-phosphate 3-phosphatidyltransferase [Tissierellia bacterium]